MRIAETAYPLPDGRVLTIRSAAPKDAASLALHRCITSGETPFMARYPEECTLDTAALGAWLQGMAEDAQNFAVTAFDGGNVVGDLGIQRVRAHLKMQHRANLGVSIQAAYCGCGLGRAMLQIAVAQARENGFEQTSLASSRTMCAPFISTSRSDLRTSAVRRARSA